MHDVAPAADQVPGAHAVHAVRPVPSAEKVPAGHAPQLYPPPPPSLQLVPLRHGLAPPQVPAEHTSVVVHASPSEQALPVDGPQVPSAVAPAATLHAWQSVEPPPHAALQHTPSTQKPDKHDAAALHALPFEARRRPKYAEPWFAFAPTSSSRAPTSAVSPDTDTLSPK